MAIEQIQAINNPVFKTGVSAKTGKTWTLMQVTTDKNNLTTVFAPANVGDKLSLTWDATYSSWKAEKVNEKEVAQLEALRKLYELNLAIFKAVTGEEYGKHTQVVKEAPTAAELPPEHIESTNFDEDDIDISTIPF